MIANQSTLLDKLSVDLFEQSVCMCVCVKGTSELLVSVPCPLLQAMSRVFMSALHPRRELSEAGGELLHLLDDRCKRPE